MARAAVAGQGASLVSTAAGDCDLRAGLFDAAPLSTSGAAGTTGPPPLGGEGAIELSVQPAATGSRNKARVDAIDRPVTERMG